MTRNQDGLISGGRHERGVPEGVNMEPLRGYHILLEAFFVLEFNKIRLF